ncbi:metal ABC transporter substrate-binding protein [Thermodesulfatator atlanticus]|uniref:metal ABC transporter substrate-binding protein n=1 Tax=Thermodesulfatator atlanticus TaxID=501497 RepID=UPI0003B79059|nr:zinc ABC transporter substrate-binding protein [Thermodesulfatator atlanticus]
MKCIAITMMFFLGQHCSSGFVPIFRSKKWERILKSVVCLILLVSAFSGLAWAKKPLVVTSIFPLAEMAKFVGGNEIKVRLLMPPGADPHSWEPTPRDIFELNKASLLIAVGGGLEPWLDDVVASLKNGRLKLLFMYQGKAPLEHHGHEKNKHPEEELDPHLWLDFPRDAAFARRIAKELAEIDPSKREIFLKRGEELSQKFLKLHQAFGANLAKCSLRIVPLAGHQAFSYWEKNYGLKFVALSGFSPEAEPTPRAISKMIKLMKDKNLKAVYYSEPRRLRFARLIAQETGARVFYLSTGAILTRKEISKGVSFFELMWRNLRHLCEGLDCPCAVFGQN